MDILESLKKRVTFEHIESEGLLLDMGMAPDEVVKMRQERLFSPTSESQRRLAEFKARFVDGDELWYYEWKREALSGTGGYAIIRGGAVVASFTSWKS